MAKLYSRRRGKSGSIRPVSKKPPAWCKYTPEEVEALVVKLSKEGNSPSMIGLILRDRYGIPLVKPIVEKTVKEIISGAGLASKLPEELEVLLKRAVELKKHLEKNRKDYRNKHALALVESKIHRLAKYYRDKGAIPSDWKYKAFVASVT